MPVRVISDTKCNKTALNIRFMYANFHAEDNLKMAGTAAEMSSYDKGLKIYEGQRLVNEK